MSHMGPKVRGSFLVHCGAQNLALPQPMLDYQFGECRFLLSKNIGFVLLSRGVNLSIARQPE